MLTPHYQDPFATIYHGEALAVIAELESASVDGLVTDPPYSSGGMVRSDRMGKTSSKYVQSDSTNRTLSDFSGDNRDQRGYNYWMAMWLAEASRVLKPGAPALLFTDWRQLPSTTDALQAGGFVWRGIVPWVKPSARPMAGRFTNQAEYVVWGSNGAMGLDFEAPVFPGFYQANPPREREHITQKPLDVMRQLVQIVPQGGGNPRAVPRLGNDCRCGANRGPSSCRCREGARVCRGVDAPGARDTVPRSARRRRFRLLRAR